MQIYLKHQKHGIKIASIELEAIADEKNGWVRYTPDTPAIDSSADAVPMNALGIKRGRPRKEIAEEV